MPLERKNWFLLGGVLISLGAAMPANSQCPTDYKYLKLAEDAAATVLASSTPTVVDISTMQGWNMGNYVKPNSKSRPRGWAISKKKGVSPVSLPQELQMWSLTAKLKEVIPATDGDYHLVLEDSSNNTVIAEIVNDACVSSTNPYKGWISSVRSFFVANNKKMLGKNITVMGPAFFDKKHVITGASPNYAEIHPVLGIK